MGNKAPAGCNYIKNPFRFILWGKNRVTIDLGKVGINENRLREGVGTEKRISDSFEYVLKRGANKKIYRGGNEMFQC